MSWNTVYQLPVQGALYMPIEHQPQKTASERIVGKFLSKNLLKSGGTFRTTLATSEMTIIDGMHLSTVISLDPVTDDLQPKASQV